MSHVFPVDMVAQAIVSRIRTARNTFSPVLKTADFDQNWNVPSNVQKLEDTLPTVILQLDQCNFSVQNYVVSQPYRWLLNYIYPLTGSNRIQPLQAMSVLGSLFSVGDQLDEVPEIVLAVGEGQLVACEVDTMAMSQALNEFNLGWAQLGMTTTILSV